MLNEFRTGKSMTVDREINVVLQKKPPKITKVAPLNENDDEEKLNVNDSIKIYYTILEVFGLQKVNMEKESVESAGLGSKLYALLLAAALLGFQLYFIVTGMMSNEAIVNPTDMVVSLLGTVPSTLAVVVSILMSATCNRSMIVRVLKNFQLIDKQLRIKDNAVYSRMKNKIIIFLSVTTLITIVMYAYLFYVKGEWINGTLDILIATIKELTLMELALLIYVITTRLDIMNEQLKETKYDFCKLFDSEMQQRKQKSDMLVESVTARLGITNYQKKAPDPEDEETVEDITRLMRIFDRLADNANIVNSCFGIPLLCSAIAVFVNILSSVNDLIKLKKDEELIVGSLVLWCLRDLIFVTIVTIACESLQGKVKDTTNVINKLSISSKIDERRQELLERFSQLMACRTFTITACNFFPFDFTFIYSLVGAVATYTVILLQVNQTPTKKTDNSTAINSTMSPTNTTQ